MQSIRYCRKDLLLEEMASIFFAFCSIKLRPPALTLVVALIVFLGGCAAGSASVQETQANPRSADELLVVDCLLPGQVRKLGRQFTYLTPRRPIKTTSVDCEIRGGEYVAYDRANYATALKIWLPKAQEGDPAAQTYVGEIYEKGLGIKADYALAAQWYQKAAAQGYARAQINLGYLYEAGLGVPQDLTKAMNWYRQASGLTGGNLEYVSSVEAAQRQAAKKEAVKLKQQVTQLQEQLSQARQNLEGYQAELQKAQQEREALQKKLEKQKRLTAVPSREAEAGVSLDGKTRAQLQRQLQEARQEQQRLIEKLAQQQLETADLRQALGQTQAALENRRTELQAAQAEQEQVKAELERLKGAAATEDKAGEMERLSSKLNHLRQVVKTQKERIASLEATMQGQRSKLAEELQQEQGKTQQLQLALTKRNEEIKALQSQLAEVQHSLATQKQSARAEIKALEENLRQRRTKLEEQKRKIEEQKREIEQLMATATALEETPAMNAVVGASQVGPSIEIIEPPLSATRGNLSALLRTTVSKIELVGKVAPKEDILSFRVNDQVQELLDSGLFKMRLPVQKPETPVNIVAIDSDGNRTTLDFSIVPATRKTQEIDKEKPSGEGAKELRAIEFGNYHALIIGNNHYQYLPDLKAAGQDAEAVAEVLQSKYGFKTKVLLDADRYAILSALNELREKLTKKDNLLLYYAGHGHLENVNLRGYWLPVDAEPDNSANWISNVAITDILNVMAAKHILVVADSCYSGALTRSSLARLQTGMSGESKIKWFKVMAKTKARIALTSGGLKPVLDSGAGDHSIFTKAFLDVLQENDEILEGFRLYNEIQKRVTRAANSLGVDQDPQYVPIKYAGHEAGEFFFFPAGLAAERAKESPMLAYAQ